jgi:DNA invertase Pin-like site-specific DNA recombinase
MVVGTVIAWLDSALPKGSDMDTQSTRPIRAVEYVRMSTDMQQYSIACEQAANRLYAAQRGLEVVRTYSDEGRSGLSIEGRDSLVRLLADAESDGRDFEIILVYDVSRWGRFQDSDESAYYEFRCRKAGVRVEYCAEPFTNDGGPIAAVMKAIKRAMAAEFSRELSVKIAAAQLRGLAAGYFQGGKPGYGFRRRRVDAKGRSQGILRNGVWKGTKIQRTMLVKGPIGEVRTVQRIFVLYVRRGLSAQQIAAKLNAEGCPYLDGKKWVRHQVHFMLRNERYLGIEVHRRTSSGLSLGKRSTRRVRNPPSQWIRQPLGFPGFVSRGLFEGARAKAKKYSERFDDKPFLLEKLKRALAYHGRLTQKLINSTRGMPSAEVYQRRFGSLRRAYALIGYSYPYDWNGKPASLERLRISSALIDRIRAAFSEIGGIAKWHASYHVLTVNGGFTIATRVARCTTYRTGNKPLWYYRTERSFDPDVTILIRLNSDDSVKDYLYLTAETVAPFINHHFDDLPAPQDFRCRSVDEVVVKLLKSNAIR